MLFNSWAFAAFFCTTFAIYLLLDHRRQNLLLLAASYVFYGLWNWKFLSLIAFATAFDFTVSHAIHATAAPRRRKLLAAASVVVHVGILGFFKYFGFFADSARALLGALGWHLPAPVLHIVLPVGISFFTFQSLSYIIDVFRGRVEPARRFLDYALYVAFFPQMVAGPIERGAHLLPQIQAPRTLEGDRLIEGCFLIFTGLYLKVFVADNLAPIVGAVFDDPGAAGPGVLVGFYAFTFQIFCDFAGYTNIARGVGRLLGFDIVVNFRTPYLAQNPREFWQRWHISLSSWLRDYLYIPLGGNRGGALATFRNLMITMLLGGLWHGASWTFVAWGGYHGALLVGHRLLEPGLRALPRPGGRAWAAVARGAKTLLCFHFVCLGWVLFRADSMGRVADLLARLTHPASAAWGPAALKVAGLLALLVPLQLLERRHDDGFALLRTPALVQAGVFFVMFWSMVLLGVRTGEQFIYFQF